MTAKDFKVGEKVMVKYGLKCDVQYGRIRANDYMVAMGGKILTIRQVNGHDYLVEENSWYWTDQMLKKMPQGPLKPRKGDLVLHDGRKGMLINDIQVSIKDGSIIDLYVDDIKKVKVLKRREEIKDWWRYL